MIEIDPIDFQDWPGLHALLTGAFAGMSGRIDPPSSLVRMSAETLRDKAGQEQLFLIRDTSGPVACLFARETPEADYYIGKLAVRPDRQGEGLARHLVEAAAAEARRRGLAALTLETAVQGAQDETGSQSAHAEIGARPRPLKPRLTEAEKEAHRAFMARLGDEPLWVKLGLVDPPA